MERGELGRMLPAFINNVIESGKLALCICFGMEAVAASFGSYPASHLEEGTGKVFNLGYGTVRLEPSARGDPIFSEYQDQTKAIFAHRYFVQRLPDGATALAKTILVPIAAFRMGSLYCVQWQPDLDIGLLVKSAEQHRGKLAGRAAYEPMLNPYNIESRYRPEYDVQNAQALDLFLRKIIE
jgi:GMP synthase-like glutamine amidotransferase